MKKILIVIFLAIFVGCMDNAVSPEDYIVGLLYADLMEELAQRDLDNDKFDAYTLKMSKANDIREKISFLARINTNDKVCINCDNPNFCSISINN